MSGTNADPPQEVSPVKTMAKERENPPFDVRRMTYAMHGGQKNTHLKLRFMREIERDPAFKLSDIHDLSKDEIRERTMAKFRVMIHHVTSEPLEIFTKRMELISVADPAFWTRFGVHYGLFLGAIRSAATSNQFSYWLEKGVLGLNGMIGCFGMTELAHGSNVAGLETTATFDEKTDEFVIHTPTVNATKWWIGGAAQTATHCAVFARLLVHGKDFGTKTFVVPLRDPKTFALLPGINIGDIGKKMGRDGIDNGYIQFTYVRVPRAYMLMKYTQVTREGDVQEPPLAQLTYGALLQGRTAMVADAGNIAKKALTVAVRYAAVRRQFKTGDNTIETQILDYPIHQRRLMPLVAQAVALGFTAQQLTALFENMTQALETLDASSDKDQLNEVIETLKETHSTSAGLKAFCTWASLETIDKCRHALGGHGYSAYSNLAAMFNDQAVQCTWEGDNTILSLQAGRSLIGSYLDAESGKKIAAAASYLNRLPEVLSERCPEKASAEEVVSLETMDKAWATIGANVIKRAADVYQTQIKAGKNKDVANEQTSQERFVAARVHTSGYIFRQFVSGVKDHAKANPEDEKNGVVSHLYTIAQLYGLWQIDENAAFFLKHKFYTAEQMDVISAKVTELCLTVRKFAVPLIDSFCYTDHIINSPLGRFDGDVYTAYFNQVRNANPLPKVHPYFDRLIKPLLERPGADYEDAGEAIGIDEEIQEIREEREEAQKEKEEEKSE